MKRLIKTKEDFLELFDRIQPGTKVKDYIGVSCFAPEGIVEKLKRSKNFVSELFSYCYLPGDYKYQRYYYEGFTIFTEFLGLWYCGFRNLEAIERIMAADKKKYFAELVYKDSMFADYSELEINEWDKHSESYYREEGEIQTCFTFRRKPILYEQIQVFLKNCSETTTSYIVSDFFKHPRKVEICENIFLKKYKKVNALFAISDLLKGCTDDFIKNTAVPIVRQEGFSQKSFNYLENELTKDCDTWEYTSKKEKISYTQEELNLEWVKDGYRFLLPRNVKMVCTLNNIKFNPDNKFIDPEVIDKWTTEIYVKRGNKYKFLIELSRYEGDDFFTLDEVSLPRSCSHQRLVLNEYYLIKQWCNEKNIVIDYYNSELESLY